MASFIEMPKLSDTMTEGTVVKWRKAIGEPVEMGDVVAEVETDKAVMELEAFGEGTLSEIYVQEGGKARIGEKLARLSAPGEGTMPKQRENPMAGQAPVSSATPAQAGAPKAQPAAVCSTPSPQPPTPMVISPGPPPAVRGRVKASPLARKLAAAQGVDLASLHGSGPGGRIIARDIPPTAPPVAPAPTPAPQAVREAPPKAPPPAPVVSTGDRRIPLSGARRIIAERLLASKRDIPHFYLQIEVDVGEMMRLRSQLNAAMDKAQLGKLTVNDFVLKAAVVAATRVPRVNASFAGDAIIEYGHVHLAVAVAIDEGLVTPVVREAERKSLREISLAVKDLAARARSKKLKPEEYQGGTLTASNLGSYGIDSFSAIINPPQAAILAIGALMKKPVVNAEGQVVAGSRMAVGLSADHRVVDGAVGAQFLSSFRELIESPALLLL